MRGLFGTAFLLISTACFAADYIPPGDTGQRPRVYRPAYGPPVYYGGPVYGAPVYGPPAYDPTMYYRGPLPSGGSPWALAQPRWWR